MTSVRMSPREQPFFWNSPTRVIMAAMAVLNFIASISSATFLMVLWIEDSLAGV